MSYLKALVFITVLVAVHAQHVIHGHSSVALPGHSITNATIAGTETGCKHRSNYFVNPNTKFQMCTGQTDQDLKNGMSIINLINSRGFLPTCRVMQLMLWMAATVNERNHIGRELFVDVGANIGTFDYILLLYKFYLCFTHIGIPVPCFQDPAQFIWQHWASL